MARGKQLSDDAREVIYRVYLYFTVEAEKLETEDGYFKKVSYRVSQATGISKRCLSSLVKEKGRPGSEAFIKRLDEALEKSRKCDNAQNEHIPKTLKSDGQDDTDTEDDSASKMDTTMLVGKTELPIVKCSTQVSVPAENISIFTTTHKKQYVKCVPIQPGPAITKVRDIRQILDIDEIPSTVSTQTSFATLMKAMPTSKTPETLLPKLTHIDKSSAEVIFVKALNSTSEPAHLSGTLSSAVTIKPFPTIIQVHRKRQSNTEVETTQNIKNICSKPIIPPEFIKLEARTTPAELDTVLVTEDIKTEIKTEIDDCDLK